MPLGLSGAGSAWYTGRGCAAARFFFPSARNPCFIPRDAKPARQCNFTPAGAAITSSDASLGRVDRLVLWSRYPPPPRRGARRVAPQPAGTFGSRGRRHYRRHVPQSDALSPRDPADVRRRHRGVGCTHDHRGRGRGAIRATARARCHDPHSALGQLRHAGHVRRTPLSPDHYFQEAQECRREPSG